MHIQIYCQSYFTVVIYYQMHGLFNLYDAILA